MCGIAGFSYPNPDLIHQMTEKIRHRGPDAGGHFTDENVSLGHRRLSILDLSEKGIQPMKFGDLVITFNGEIYNFEEIRSELISKGHAFISDTDTEVILHAFQEWGPECMHRFNGMWAFCIYDQQKKQLFLARDRFGIKPLYYSFSGENLHFCSEITPFENTGIPLTISAKGLNFFLYQKYIGAGGTIWNEVKKLAPGHFLEFDLTSKKINIEAYYNLEDEIEKAKKIPLAERLQQCEPLIEDTVKLRLIADVPVGAFLSGGVDSSLISALIIRHKPDLKTFSVGFREKTFDETAHSDLVAKHIGSQHRNEILEMDEKLIPEVLDQIDEPFGDPSLLPTFLLSRMTRREVTVALSGDAADELFGGYDAYKAFVLAKMIPDFTVRPAKEILKFFPASDKNLSLIFKAKKFFADYHPHKVRRHLNWLSQAGESVRKELLNDAYLSDNEILGLTEDQDLLAVQLSDMHNYMVDDILKKVDTASMLNSLEVRVPFLDYRLVPLALSLPDKYKIKGTQTKHFLKEITRKYVPSSVIDRPKKGFAVPISKWIKQSELIRSFLNDSDKIQPVFSAPFVRKLYEAHRTGQADNSRILWLIFVYNYRLQNNR